MILHILSVRNVQYKMLVKDPSRKHDGNGGSR